ncbi:hypothetical protein INT45_011099 [Circinella minor]|uniref:Uncharacterized protein n=1 Tax=Circinella minor TaxID=1195481 RepID=A0A8H7VR52_9FUNG|nr:hypothetical protein INT45_011099 [Circinella minor]
MDTVIYLLSSPTVIKLVTKTVLDGRNDIYTCIAVDKGNGKIPFFSLFATNADHNVRLNTAPLQVAEKYDCEVYFILLCTGQISPSIKMKLLAIVDNLYWWQPHSAFWAKKCIFVPKVALNSDSDVDQSLDPLAALTLYISSTDEERLKLKDVANSTIQLLQTVSEKSRSTIFDF